MEAKKIAVIDARQHGKVAALAAGFGEPIVAAEGEDIYETVARQVMTEPNGIPNRMSIDRASPYYASGGEYVGVRFKGQDVTGRVVEYSVSENWVRLSDQPSGTKLSYQQVKDAQKSYGPVETFWARQPNRQVRRQLARVR